MSSLNLEAEKQTRLGALSRQESAYNYVRVPYRYLRMVIVRGGRKSLLASLMEYNSVYNSISVTEAAYLPPWLSR